MIAGLALRAGEEFAPHGRRGTSPPACSERDRIAGIFLRFLDDYPVLGEYSWLGQKGDARWGTAGRSLARVASAALAGHPGFTHGTVACDRL